MHSNRLSSGANIVILQGFVFIKHSINMENVPKNGLRRLYDSLPERQHVAPKKALIDRLAKATKKHPQTVKGWIYGTYTPDALTQDAISRELKIPVSELF